MELTIIMRLRIAAAMAVGAALLGFLCWPLIAPVDPLGAVTFFTGEITVSDAMICVIMAYLAGLGGYFAAFPYGRQIAPLAAPAGLAVWAFRGGDMLSLLRPNHTFEKRLVLYTALKWESLFWLLLVGAGFLGVLTGEKLCKSKPSSITETPKASSSGFQSVLSIIIAMIATIIIAHSATAVFAQDVRMFDSQLGAVVAQPSKGQIAFAVFVSFGIAAFVVKKFLDTSYVFTSIAAVGVVFTGAAISAKPDVLTHMVENWPVVFFARAIGAILPLQVMAFAPLGAITGYWLAVKHSYTQKHGN